MATLPVPFIRGAPEGDRILDNPPVVPPDPEVNVAVAAANPLINTPFSNSFRPRDVTQEPTYEQPGYYYLNNQIDITNTNSSDPYANTPYSVNSRAPAANQEPFPEAPVYQYNPENDSGNVGGNGPVQAGITDAQNSNKLENVQVLGNYAPDWRVRLQLAPGSNYLYNAPDPGILRPLRSGSATTGPAAGGVIFPYTPSIQVTYQANYETVDLTHTNYKQHNYKNSSVESIIISGKFTAQDTVEANYLLAVIHFFRSVTKMFYGRDQNPTKGIPPPLCYLTGHGDYMFDHHPLVVSNFQLSLPDDVDYINAGPEIGGDAGFTPYAPPQSGQSSSFYRLRAANLQPGAVPNPPKFEQESLSQVNTRVPTIMTIAITCHAIVTRKDMSNKFSLRDYANGKLMGGNMNGLRRGFW